MSVVTNVELWRTVTRQECPWLWRDFPTGSRFVLLSKVGNLAVVCLPDLTPSFRVPLNALIPDQALRT